MLAAEAGPCVPLGPGPDLHTVSINNAYVAATLTVPADVRGHSPVRRLS